MRHSFVFPVLLASGFFLPLTSEAIILYGGDNTANTSAAGAPSGLPFDSVGKTGDGSAVYLGNGYMLTANHVTPGDVTFSTGTYAADSTFTPVQVAPGVDLKIFRLVTLPSVTAVNLFAGNVNSVAGVTSYNVGWGVGRDPGVPVNSASVAWGDDTTQAHRWGTQTVVAAGSTSASDGYPYSYFALQTRAAGTSASGAALTVHDSGSALFTKISGTWYLTGIATAVETAGASDFGNGTTTGDINQFVNISAYKGDIAAVIPESSTWVFGGIVTGVIAIAAKARRRKRG